MRFCLFAWIVVGALLLPHGVLAAPETIVLFPEGGQVTDVREIAGESQEIVWELRGQVAPDSVRVRLPDGGTIEGLQTSRVELEAEEVAPELVSKVETAKRQLEKLRVRQQAAESEVALIQGLADAGEVDWKQSTSWREQLEAALHRSSALGEDIASINATLTAAQDEIDRLLQQPRWRVQVRISELPAGGAEAELHYRLNDCGWDPLYRVEGLSEQGEVRFTWRARIHQQSGLKWSGVDMTVATVPPRTRLRPPEVPDWIMRPQPEVRPMAKQAGETAMLAAEDSRSARAPHHTAATGFSLWHVGQMDLADGEQQVVTLEDRTLAAEFTRLARPERSNQVFVRAALASPLERDLLQGPGQFFLDGVFLRQQRLDAVGQELFFGTDPFVQAKMRSRTIQSGDEGVLARRQTQRWEWDIVLANKRQRPVDVRVELAAAQSRHEDIRVEQEFSTPAKRQENRYFLDLTVPAQGEREARMTVRAEAPKDMPVWWGR